MLFVTNSLDHLMCKMACKENKSQRLLSQFLVGHVGTSSDLYWWKIAANITISLGHSVYYITLHFF